MGSGRVLRLGSTTAERQQNCERGALGLQRSGPYVKVFQKFLPSFKRSESRNPAVCNQLASVHGGANKRPLACLDQNAEEAKLSFGMIKKFIRYSAITTSLITGCYASASP